MRVRLVLVLIVSVFMAALPALGEADESMDHRTGVIAEFEGELIDLSEGWGDARACAAWTSDKDVECFRTEAELLERAEELELGQVSGSGSVLAACSSSLRLYDGLSYTVPVLYLYEQTWTNLSSFGFSNRTSSYKVGGCSAYFADGANGGGDWYPTHLTQSWDLASSMISGWNNRVSSVYIN